MALLDTHTGAAGAYSLRKISDTYSGSCLRIRRGDGQTRFIGFDGNGDLDVAQIKSWCDATTSGTSEGFVRTWFDQSGNGNDATTTDTTKMPRIYDGTSVITKDGRPALEFDGSSDQLPLPDAVQPANINNCSAFTVQAPNNGGALELSATSVKWIQPFGWFIPTEYFGYGTNNGAIGGYTVTQDKQRIITAIAGSTQGDCQVFSDGVSQGSTPLVSATPLSGQASIGGSSTNLLEGHAQEIIVYHSDESGNRTAIESDMSAYWTANRLLLNTYHGAGAAYSLRKVNADYTGSAIRIREDGGDTETDIGFDSNGDLNVADIASWCTTNNGYVVTWYDQSGSGQDVTQGTAANQPQIYNGTAVLTDNGKPCVEFDGSDDLLTATNTAFSGNNQSMFVVNNTDATSGNPFRAMVCIGPVVGWKMRILVHGPEIHFDVVNNSVTWDGSPGSQNLLALVPEGGASTVLDYNLYQDGSLLTPTATNQTQNLQDCAGGLIKLGYNFPSTPGASQYHFDGKLQEVILYNSDQSADRGGVEFDINSYYGIYDSLFLDEYHGAAAGYSVRKLKGGYTGPCIRIREDGGNTETDIGFDVNGELDTNAIAAWCGSNNGFVVTWYDQSGNGRDAAAAADTNEPKIYDGTNGQITENSKPAIEWTTSHSLQTAATLPAADLDDYSTTLVFSGGSGFQVPAKVVQGSAFVYPVEINSGEYWVRWGNSASRTSLGSTDAGHHLVAVYGRDSSLTSYAYLDGSQVSITNSGAAVPVSHAITFGNGAGSAFAGKLQEHIVWHSDEFSNHTGIYSGINGYFSVYSPITEVSFAASASASSEIVSAPPPSMTAGINTQRIRSFNCDEPFRDAFKKARAWVPVLNGAWNTGSLSINSDGTVENLDAGQYNSGTILDDYTGAAAAYSLRKLSASYSGAAIRIREDGGDTETDIGFDASGELDTNAISAWCGTNNGFVVTWYDQSGNSNNVTQITQTRQPQVYNGSEVITRNGKPTILFSTVGTTVQGLEGTALSASNRSRTIFSVASLEVAGAAAKIAAGALSSTYQYWSTIGASRFVTSANRTSGRYDAFTIVAETVGSQVVRTDIANTTNVQIYKDGTQVDSRADNNADWSQTSWGLGGLPSLGGGGSNHATSELIMYESDQSANRADIEADISAYWMEGGSLIASTLINDNFSAINSGGPYEEPNPLYTTGDYTLIFEGTGTIRARNDATDTTYTDGGTYTVAVNTATDQGIRLDLTSTDPSDPVRNIRLLLPGFSSTDVSFDPTDGRRILTDRYKALLDDYPMVRFMQLQDINSNNYHVDWSDRTPWRAQQGGEGAGISWEMLAAIINELGKPAWICIPHQATDAYVTSAATYLRDNLDPDINFYLEYSNETWNPIYTQYDYCDAQGALRGYTGSEYDRVLKFTSERSKEIFDIFETVFGGTSRFTRVVASQFVNTYTGNLVLSFNNNYTGFDAYAVGPYFGGTLTADGSSTLDTLETALSQEIQVTNRGYVAANRTLADSYGVSLIAYEGGQHIVSGTYTALFSELNRDARMGSLYKQYLEMLNEEGMEVFTAYRLNGPYNAGGFWGLQIYEQSSLATFPKKQAVLDFFSAGYSGVVVSRSDSPSATSTYSGSLQTNFDGLLLDEFAGSTAAFSVRKLSSSYSGPCLQVRNMTSGLTQDIGFDAEGVVDVAAIESFCGQDSGVVSTWYDQSGSGSHMTQTNPLLMPTICSGGQVVRSNGRPSVFWDNSLGVANELEFTTSDTTLSLLLVQETDDDQFILISSPTVAARWHLMASASTGTAWTRFDTTYDQVTGSINGGATTIQNGVTTRLDNQTYYTGAGQNVSFFWNMDNVPADTYFVGDYQHNSVNDYKYEGYISELIFFGPDYSANRLMIDQDANRFFRTYGSHGLTFSVAAASTVYSNYLNTLDYPTLSSGRDAMRLRAYEWAEANDLDFVFDNGVGIDPTRTSRTTLVWGWRPESRDRLDAGTIEHNGVCLARILQPSLPASGYSGIPLVERMTLAQSLVDHFRGQEFGRLEVLPESAISTVPSDQPMEAIEAEIRWSYREDVTALGYVGQMDGDGAVAAYNAFRARMAALTLNCTPHFDGLPPGLAIELPVAVCSFSVSPGIPVSMHVTRHTGQIAVGLHYELETGVQSAQQDVDTIVGAFDSVSVGRVSFGVPQTTVIGRTAGDTWQVNVLLPFVFQDIFTS